MWPKYRPILVFLRRSANQISSWYCHGKIAKMGLYNASCFFKHSTNFSTSIIGHRPVSWASLHCPIGLQPHCPHNELIILMNMNAGVLWLAMIYDCCINSTSLHPLTHVDDTRQLIKNRALLDFLLRWRTTTDALWKLKWKSVCLK